MPEEIAGEMGMKIVRIKENPSAGIDTHHWSSFRRIISEVLYGGCTDPIIVDPFARNCPLGDEWTNDINPTTSANHHLDALEFLQLVPSGLADFVIFDPPFSVHQADRKYGEGANIYAEPGRIGAMMKEIGRILKPGGTLIKFGYNTTQHFKWLELQSIYILNFAGNRNDVLVSTWKNCTRTLNDF